MDAGKGRTLGAAVPGMEGGKTIPMPHVAVVGGPPFAAFRDAPLAVLPRRNPSTNSSRVAIEGKKPPPQVVGIGGVGELTGGALRENGATRRAVRSRKPGHTGAATEVVAGVVFAPFVVVVAP